MPDLKECNKCTPAILAITDAFSTASPPYQEQVVQSQAVELKQTMDENGVCPTESGWICGVIQWVIDRFQG